MMNNSIIAGALFDFMGWLTSRPKRIMLSSVDDASPAVDAIKDFAKMRGLSLDDAQVETWQEALAQPEQEPVAWMTINEYGEEDDIHYENPEGHLMEGWTYKPLYTHPPTVQPEKEPLEYWNAVEGWVKIDEVREHFGSVGCGTIYKTAGEDRVPVYITPPPRQPLTHEQRVDLLVKFEAHKHEWHAPAILIDMVEAAHGIKE